MRAKQLAPPAALAVSLADAKDTLRIEQSDTSLDALLTLWIKAITITAEHATSRAFINRPLALTLDYFPDAIQLELAPLVDVESIKFFDVDGAEQTLDPADYYVDTITEPGYVVPGAGKAFPDTADQINALTVSYTSGYGSDAGSVPEAARLHILARLAEQWEAETKEFKETVASDFISGLLDSIKVYG